MPVVYAMSRRKLAIVLKKKFKIGCVGIFSYDGAEVAMCSINGVHFHGATLASVCAH